MPLTNTPLPWLSEHHPRDPSLSVILREIMESIVCICMPIECSSSKGTSEPSFCGDHVHPGDTLVRLWPGYLIGSTTPHSLGVELQKLNRVNGAADWRSLVTGTALGIPEELSNRSGQEEQIKGRICLR